MVPVVEGLVVLVLVLSSAFPPLALAQFETRGQFRAQESPFSIAVGDFNHDGKLDMAVATGATSTDNVVILFGLGDGTFRKPVYYTAGIGSVSITAVDLNQDGNLDLAVASHKGYISILFGNSDGTFQPEIQSPPVPTFEQYVTTGDFNGDGKLDLIALSLNNPCKCISVLMGNGDGTFQDAVITRPSFAVFTIGVGDFNGDGKLDLATAGQFGTQKYVNILLGNGDGKFHRGASYPGEGSPASIAIADFNGDGELDMAIANSQGIGVRVWMGNGDGTFQRGADYPTAFPTWVIAADLNGDGKIDLAAANFLFSSGATVFLGNGDGTFQAGTFYSASDEPRSLAVGDFNGDGKPDLALTDYLRDDIVVLLNTGTVSFSPTTAMVFPAQLVNSGSPPQTVTLTNAAATHLNISSISASGPFHVDGTCDKSVGAGASCNIQVRFEPEEMGAANGLITIRDSASSKPQVIQVSGAGTVIGLSPRSLSFGEQEVGSTSDPLMVTVKNHGGAPVTFSTIATDGPNASNFIQTNNCNVQLSPGSSCIIRIRFTPNKPGERTATLNVGDNGGGSPQMVSLSGIGD